MLLDKNDMLSLYRTKKIVKSVPFIRKNGSAFLSENNAINALFISINLGIIWYQYAYASLVREAQVPAGLSVGDLLATPVTGAYGYSMGSNYNLVPRPPVVFVADGQARLVVRRETYDDLIRRDLD
jgi:hypothetical protein